MWTRNWLKKGAREWMTGAGAEFRNQTAISEVEAEKSAESQQN